MSSNTYRIAALAGDGIGPEVMREALSVLRAVGDKFSLKFDVTEAPVGWAGIDAAGKALPDATLELCRRSDSILFGSVGLPDRDPTIPKEQRPERAALLRIRKEFGLFANLRPVRLPKALSDLEGLLNKNRIFRDRLEGVGVISHADAIAWSLSGPMARASATGISRTFL